MPDFLSVKPNINRRSSLPRGVPHGPQSRTPRIQIPRNRISQPPLSSPLTSSLEDSGLHLRYHSMSQHIKPSAQFAGQASPPPISASATSSSPSFPRDQNSGSGLSHGLVTPIPPSPIEIPRSRPRRSFPNSPRTSSEESDFHSGHHPMVRSTGSMSPSRRRATPPRTSPPDVPLPPIPFDEQDVGSSNGISRKGLHAEQPPTPVRCDFMSPSTPSRPLPIQPIPSPVPGSVESGHTDAINGNSLRHHWQEPNGGLLSSNDIVRQDSPVYEFHEDHASPTGIGAPPPYVDQFDIYSAPDTQTIGEALDRAVSVCGGSLEVRLEVSKCIGFHSGYEPPYWQTRLQACGLNAEAAKYLVDEMSKNVDWTASFGRAI